MEMKYLADIVNNVFIMWGAFWLIDNVKSGMDLNIKSVIAFFIMMALYFWRIGK